METYPKEFIRASGTLLPTKFGRDRKQIYGGILSKHQAIMKECLTVGRLANLGELSDIDGSRNKLSTAVFAGYAIDHFGHFLTESIGTLPNISPTHADGPLLFLAGNRKTKQLNVWQKEILHLLGWSRPALIVDKTTFVENLIVPRVSFHQNKLGYGDDSGLKWRATLFPDSSKRGRKKIYLSRSKLSKSLGHFKDEEELEVRLRHYGYQILHTQTMTVEEQINAYRDATHIVLAESSAIHLLNLVCNSHQKIALIQRRPKIHGSIRRATRYFSRAQVIGIDAILSFEGEKAHNWPQYKGVSRIDLELVEALLLEYSFLGTHSNFENRIRNENIYLDPSLFSMRVKSLSACKTDLLP